MTVPIYITAAILAVIVAWTSDRVGKRSPFIVVFLCIMIVGFSMQVTDVAFSNIFTLTIETGVFPPPIQRSCMAAFSLRLALFTQHSLASLHGWPTIFPEATSEVLVWLFRSVLETLAA